MIVVIVWKLGSDEHYQIENIKYHFRCHGIVVGARRGGIVTKLPAVSDSLLRQVVCQADQMLEMLSRKITCILLACTGEYCEYLLLAKS